MAVSAPTHPDHRRSFLAGEVRLLTNPVTAGYVQNPISVYYCYNTKGSLELCIAEVTNTPWAAKVRFLFRPAGEEVPKALHVSPFMDMQSTWYLFLLPATDEHAVT